MPNIMATQYHTIKKTFICGKCGGCRKSKECKNKETPAKCALCRGNHPAN